MNTFGVHALVWEGNLERAAVEHIVRNTKKAGYDLVEFSLHDTDMLDEGHARALLEEAGLQVSCSRGLAFDADVSSDDPAVVAKGVQLLEHSLKVAHGLGSRYLCGGLYSAFGKYHKPVTKKGLQHVVESLKRVADVAAGYDITLGLEVVNRYESNVVNTTAQALEILDKVQADNLMVHLDIYHMNIEEADFFSPVVACGDKLGYVHIGENHRGYLGSGHLDFTSFFHALAHIGYKGPITFESFSSAVVSQKLTGDLSIWRNLWSDGMDLSTNALKFMQAQARGAGLGN